MGLRITLVVLARHHTPDDVAVFFRRTGELVRQGRDPATILPRYEWNFLPLMPYVHAAEQLTGLPWALAGKLCPVLADVCVAAMLPRLTARPGIAWQYALNPVALLVSAWHGQVEPTSIALVLAAVLLLRRGHLLTAGVLLGLAVASKTWPLVFLPGLLLPLRTAARARLLAALSLPLLALLASEVLLLHAGLGEAIHVLLGYRSFFGDFGWSGVLHQLGLVGRGYAGADVDPWARGGSAVLLLACTAVLVRRARRVDALALTALLLLTFYVLTPGFGVQYLAWCVPVLLLLGRRATLPFELACWAYAAVSYLLVLPGLVDPGVGVAVSVVVVVTAAAALFRVLHDAEHLPVRWGAPVGAEGIEPPTTRL